MKKNLLWSLFAATALMTACSQEEMIEPQSLAQTPAEMRTVSLELNVGDISTYATESGVGAWTNFKGNAMPDYNVRAIIQIFDQNGTFQYVTPITDDRVIISHADLTNNAKVNGNTIKFDNIRVPVNGSYTAVAWVDFVVSGTSSAAELNDFYYKTANLSKVETLKFNDQKVLALDKCPEGRDAYTGKVNFSIASDGKFMDADEAEITGVLDITAKRPFAKVRVIMTDWNNKAAWFNYFMGRTVAAEKIMNGLNMVVGANMATEFNAVTGVPTVVAGAGAHTFSRAWNPGDVTDAQGTDTYFDSSKAALWSYVNNVNWVTVNAGEVPGVAAGMYPVVDFQYLIPTDNTDNAMYAMTFNAMNGANTIYNRALSTVPVKKNCLTSIYGNFLTKAYSFSITIDDEFENQLNSEVVVIEDDGNVNYYDNHTFNGVEFEVIRENNPALANYGEVKTINVRNVTAAKFDAIVAHINDPDAIRNNKTNAVVNFFTESLPATADFAGMDIKDMNIILLNDIANAVEFKGLVADNFNVKGSKTFNNDVTFNNNTVGFINLSENIYANGLTVNEAAGTLCLNGGDFQNTVISNINTIVNNTATGAISPWANFSKAAASYNRVTPTVNGGVTAYPATAIYISGTTPRTLTVNSDINKFNLFNIDATRNPFKAETSNHASLGGTSVAATHKIKLANSSFTNSLISQHADEFFTVLP